MLLLLNTSSLLFYLISCWLTLRRQPKQAALLTYLLGMQFWSLLSCWYNDFGIYNLELFRHTDPSLATSCLALVYGACNCGLMLAQARLGKQELCVAQYQLPDAVRRLLHKTVVARGITIVMLAPIAYSFAMNGIPIFQGLHKALYAQQASGWEAMLLTYGYLPAFLLGMGRAITRRVTWDDWLLGCLLLFLIATGNKFSSLLLFAVCYAAPVLAKLSDDHLRQIIRLRNAGIAAAGIALFLALSFGSYAFWDNDAELARYVLADRVLANQGHLWWGTFDLHSHGHRFHPDQWNREIDAALSAGSTEIGQTGMSYLMLELLGPEKAFSIFDTGYLYTMAYPAILLTMLPLWAIVLLQLVLGLLFAVGLWYMAVVMRAGALLRSLLMLTILIPVMTAMFSGSLAVIVTGGMVMKIVLLIAAESGLFVPERGKSVRAIAHR